MTIGSTISNETWMNDINNFDVLTGGVKVANIQFQSRRRTDQSILGVTNEDLLFILIERLSYFQKTELACLQNEFALTHIKKALEHLQEREMDRLNRGVLGTGRK